MPIARFEMPDGRIGRFEVPEGTTPEQAQQMIAAQVGQRSAAAPAPAARAKPFGEDLGDAIADLPRQGGLTARHTVEGVGEFFDTFVGNPLRTLAAPVFGNAPTARTGAALADAVGLPQPRTSTERIVGDATRLLAGGAGMLGVAGKAAQTTTGMPQAVARLLASNPGQQLASAGAAGLAGGYTRETGGGDGAQFVASLAAGLAAPAALGGAQRSASAVAKRMQPAAQQLHQVNITIENALRSSGITLDQLPVQVAQSIRNDVAAAFRTSDQVSPDAIRRLADYRLTGLTPTAAGLTLDPAVVTQQKNLASLGMNLKDKTANFLGQTENRNNQLLKQGLNNLGAGAPDDAYAGGERVISALAGRNSRAQQIIAGLYDKARDSSGRSAALDHVTFTNRASDLLDEANVGSFLPADIRNKLNGFAKPGEPGGIPLTVEIAEQFKTSIARLQRSTADGNARYALGVVRQALDEAPLLNQSAPAAQLGGNQLATTGGMVAGGGAPAQNLGQEAIDAFTKARRVNRSWMQIVERTPALQAVRDGVEPDKFVQQFIVGAGKDASLLSVARMRDSIKASPDAMQAVREQILGHLKGRALNGHADETGNFGSDAYEKALNAIGERKLRLFFKPDEVNQLKALGRVARYEQFNPTGSKVNTSHTAGATGGHVARILSNIPVASPLVKQYLAEPVQNIQVGLQSGRALDVPRNLVAPAITPAQRSLLLSPAAFMGGETEEERQRRLLTP